MAQSPPSPASKVESDGQSARLETGICYITVGATAPFDALLEAALSPTVIDTLITHGFNNIFVQYGQNGDSFFRSLLDGLKDRESSESVSIQGRDLFDSLASVVRPVRGKFPTSRRPNAIVISHAGSGTVLDALRVEVPTVVVPNTSLADNHQVELATELDRLGYVVCGTLENLPAAIDRAVSKLGHSRKDAVEVAPEAGPTTATARLGDILDNEMGFIASGDSRQDLFLG